jgi:hypothetical protein
MDFYLNCWVPTLSGYARISELKNSQLQVLSKYILNEDHVGTSDCFDLILEDNVQDKDIINSLTRFDKWFIFCFLRATNISPVVYIQSTTKDGAPCNIELQLFDSLTKLSEATLSYRSTVTIEDLDFTLQAPNKLFSKNTLADSIQSINVRDSNTVIHDKASLFQVVNDHQGIAILLKDHLAKLDRQHNYRLIENKNKDIMIKDIPVRLYDNTLFLFLRSIYLPFCKGVYVKQYDLMKKLNIDFKSIKDLTPLEGEILLNLHNEAEADKKSKRNTDRH